MIGCFFPLGKSKETSKEVNKRVAEAEITKAEIDLACQGYVPVSEIGSILYFVIADLKKKQQNHTA